MPKRLRQYIFPLLAFAAFALIMLYGVFGYTSVCSQCGEIRETWECHIPRTDIIIFTHWSEHPSPVTAVLTVPKHNHNWLFCHGAGNGITCALGGGRRILPAMESSHVATAISASQRFGDLQFRDRIVNALRNPDTSDAVRHLGLMAPTNGFPNASEFHAWLERETELFDEQLEGLRKASASMLTTGQVGKTN